MFNETIIYQHYCRTFLNKRYSPREVCITSERVIPIWISPNGVASVRLTLIGPLKMKYYSSRREYFRRRQILQKRCTRRLFQRNIYINVEEIYKRAGRDETTCARENSSWLSINLAVESFQFQNHKPKIRICLELYIFNAGNFFERCTSFQCEKLGILTAWKMFRLDCRVMYVGVILTDPFEHCTRV